MASWTCCLELLGCSSALFWSSVWSWAWRSSVNCRVISSMVLYSLLSWVFFFLAMKWMILMQSLPKHLYPCLALSSVLASSPVQVAGLPMDAWTICQASSKIVSACMALLKGESILGRSLLDSNLAYPSMLLLVVSIVAHMAVRSMGNMHMGWLKLWCAKAPMNSWPRSKVALKMVPKFAKNFSSGNPWPPAYMVT